MRRLLVTGGAGFIGCNFIHYILKTYPDWEITNLDKLTYAGNLENLKAIEQNSRYRFVKGDIADPGVIAQVFSQGFTTVINFAAESHVDRSILDPSPFIETNVKGTQILLEAARHYGVEKFVQVSTDEVYGSIGTPGKFSEASPLTPNSPYAASKAAADLFCRAYYYTYNSAVVIARSSNNYGPYQFPEKLIPLAITNALEDKPIPIYGDGLNVRDWIHVRDHCQALAAIIERGKPGEIYNIGASNEWTNLELISYILDIMGKPRSLLTFVADRPGHDRRYALDATKINREISWEPAYSFEQGIRDTINWYIGHRSWWLKIKSGEYGQYYQMQYSGR